MNPPGLSAGAAGTSPPAIPHLGIDPFAISFFDDPYPAHQQMREAAPVVYLDRWNVYGVARYAEVYAVLNDPLTFCSSRGVGLSDFAKETPWRPPSLILEADPPAHTRTRAVLSKVLSPAVMKRLRDGFMAAAEAKVDELVARGSFDAIPDLAEAYPLSVFPDALGLQPEGREHLIPYASLVFNAFEEAVRFESPVQTFFRTTTRDVELGGVVIPEGEKVLMFLGAANRDPRRWERPDSYDITRKVSGHVGFGSGIHMCVGQLVARLEGEAVLTALARKVGAITMSDEPKRRYNNTLRGLESLPVTFTPA